jgi:3'-5' exoribonuclease
LKKLFVEQINERDLVETVFLVRDKNLAMAKNGKPYLTLKLMDRTGEIEGRIWDNADYIAGLFSKDDFVQVQGKASLYLGKMQLVVQSLSCMNEDDVDLADFLPVSKFSTAELQAKLGEKVASIKQDHFRQLMQLFLDDPGFMEMYSAAPAAKTMHHVFLGGLLEHSLSVADLAEDICKRYPLLNRDLLLLGALLHDVGKVAELSYRRSFDYTDEGKLLGHIMLGVEMIDAKIRQIDQFPHRDATLLKHLLLSHHGQYDYGSPKRPKTLEAVALNFIDDLDSKMNGVQSHIDKSSGVDSAWTPYHRLYDRYFYRGEKLPAPAADKPQQVKVNEQQKKKEAPFGASFRERLHGESLDLFSDATNGEKSDGD